MANVKITDLPSATTLGSTDVFPVVDVASTQTRQVTVTDLLRNTPDGTAAAPSIANAGDQDTGIYFPAANHVSVSTSGTQRLVIDGSGRVGIGTGSPAKILVVTGDASFNSVIVGRGSGDVSTNTALGAQCLETNTTGGGNVAVGFQCLRLNTEGAANVAVGREALEQNTTGSNNVAVGKTSLSVNTTGTLNIAVGVNSLRDNISGQRNVAIGNGAMSTNVGISRNTAIGYNAMRYANSDASDLAKNNVAYGYQALMGSSTAANNVGGSNVAIGANTLLDCTSGNSNVAVGHNAGTNVTTGTRNVFVGFSAGDSITTGNNNTIIGEIAGTATLANTVIIGAGTAERLRIDSSGNVGIGTSSPDHVLEVKSASFDNGIKIATSAVQDAVGNVHGRLVFEGRNAAGTVYETAKIQSVCEDSHGTRRAGLAFVTSGSTPGALSEKLRISHNGSVGIGVTDPGYELEIGGNSNIQLALTANTTSGNSQIYFGDSGDDDAGALIYRHASDSLAFEVNASERMRIDSSGRLLVGTTSASSTATSLLLQGSPDGASGPSYLRIATGTATPGSTSTIGQISFTDSGHSTAASIIAFRDGGTWSSSSKPTKITFSTTANGASSTTERMQIDSSGNVGIGEASSIDRRLHVRKDGAAAAKFGGEGGGGDYAIEIGQLSATSSPGFNATGGGSMLFKMGGTEAMRINSSRRVLIGKSSSNFANAGIELRENGEVVVTRSGGDVITTRRLVSEGTHFSLRNISGTAVGTIVTTSSGTTYNTSSDYRLKENVVDIVDGITRVKQLQPRRFNFIADDTTTVDGFLAHEAQTVVPEAVTGTHNEVDDDGNPVMQQIDKSKLVPLLTAALQESIAKIETLEAKVAALEAQ